MRKITRITKVTRLIKLSEVLADIKSEATDEEIAEKYDLTWPQMARAYSKLFYGELLTADDLSRRMAMRSGKAASHIPIVQIDDSIGRYECSFCGFNSTFHFSACPKCEALNLRRLSMKFGPATNAHDAETFMYSP